MTEKLRWTSKPPPHGVWAYSVKEGLFRIEKETVLTGYLETFQVCRFDHNCLETRTLYTVFVEGPFVYPLPDPTRGVEP